MGRDAEGLSREDRLAAKLRENLRRRKTQAKALQISDETPGETAENPALPKSLPKS